MTSFAPPAAAGRRLHAMRKASGRVPLRIKLIAALLALVVVALAVISMVGLAEFRGYLQDHADAQLRALSAQVSSPTGIGGLRSQTLSFEGYVIELRERPGTATAVQPVHRRPQRDRPECPHQQILAGGQQQQARHGSGHQRRGQLAGAGPPRRLPRDPAAVRAARAEHARDADRGRGPRPPGPGGRLAGQGRPGGQRDRRRRARHRRCRDGPGQPAAADRDRAHGRGHRGGRPVQPGALPRPPDRDGPSLPVAERDAGSRRIGVPCPGQVRGRRAAFRGADAPLPGRREP